MMSNKLVNVNMSVRAEESNRILRMKEGRQTAMAENAKRK